MPHYRDNDCTGGPEFVAGAARGKRAFFLGPDGWLRGVTYRQVWLPGENVAVCMNTKMPPRGERLSYYDLPYKAGGVWFPHGKEGTTGQLVPDWSWDRCDGLAKDCACGFYAYHDSDSGGYGAIGPAGGWGQRALGVVEGYGKLVLGPKGYRAQKARLLAVTVRGNTEAERENLKRREALQRMVHEAQELLDAPVTGLSMGALLGLAATAGLYGYAWFAQSLGAVGYGVIPLLMGAIFEGVSRREASHYKKQLDRLIKNLNADLAACPASFAESQDLMRKQYPALPVYHDSAEMYRDYPIISLTSLVEAPPNE